MQVSIIQKITLLTVLLVIVTTAVIGGLFYQQERSLLVRHALEDFSKNILEQGHKFEARINELRSDTRILAKVPPVQGMVRAAGNNGYDGVENSTAGQWASRLEVIFTNLLQAKQQYLQARFIGADGKELVRVESIDGKIRTVPEAELQNKSQRDYFIDTIRLPPGSQYLSRINLNQEYGKIVEPYQEVIRSAISIHDEIRGGIAGLVIINMDIGLLFREIREAMSADGRAIYITNDQGDYLVHPDANRTYGFHRNNYFRLQDDFPAATDFFLPGNSETGLTFLPESPLFNQALVLNRFLIDPNNPTHFITIGIAKPYRMIVSEALSTLSNVLLIAFVLVLIAASISVILSLRLTRPIKLMTRAVSQYANDASVLEDIPLGRDDEVGQLARSFAYLVRQTDVAKSDLRKMNKNLETLIQERTDELNRNRIRQQVIVQNIVDGLVSIDEQGVIQDFNRASEKIFGYSAEEVIGKKINVLMPEEFSSKHDSYMQTYHDTGEAKIIGIGREVVGKRKDGSTFPLDLAINEMWFGNERIYSGIVRDITERKQIERLKNEFISTVSHELRTPLTAIRGSIGLLLGNALGEIPDKAKEIMNIASANTERLLLLINDLLDIQKIESGKMEFKFDYFSALSFVEEALLMHKAYGEQFNIDFVLASSQDGYIHADKDRLMQVIGNLMSNAAKFSPRGSRIEISVTRYNGSILRIAVTDYGPGIADKDMAKLFSQFSQIDASDSRKKGGTGLGLAISKAIMDHMGGSIGVYSRLGEGSTFYIEMPECITDYIATEVV